MRKELLRHLSTAFGLTLLALPLVGMKVDFIEKTLDWRWGRLMGVFALTFSLSWLWRYLLVHRPQQARSSPAPGVLAARAHLLVNQRVLLLLFLVLSLVPWVAGGYQVNILITAMAYITLALGLNIVVGMAGLLDLGYVAFYAIGAYSYGLLHHYLGWGFWQSLGVGGLLAAAMGILLGIPVLRLRGDYLAIVTLGFGEILRLLLENEADFTFGVQGIPNIPKPTFFGFRFDYEGGIVFLFYIMLGILLLAITATKRLQYSRVGRAWMAIRENELAAQAMGIDLTKTKLNAFGLGAFWAGVVGVVFAAKTSFINPASFQFFESAIILSIVVLGGMGSVLGVVLAAILLILLPEYLRFLAEYRMLLFGALMVAMMIFRPQGLVPRLRPRYERDKASKA